MSAFMYAARESYYRTCIFSFTLMMTGAKINVGKLFSELKLVPDNYLFIYDLHVTSTFCRRCDGSPIITGPLSHSQADTTCTYIGH